MHSAGCAQQCWEYRFIETNHCFSLPLYSYQSHSETGSLRRDTNTNSMAAELQVHHRRKHPRTESSRHGLSWHGHSDDLPTLAHVRMQLAQLLRPLLCTCRGFLLRLRYEPEKRQHRGRQSWLERVLRPAHAMTSNSRTSWRSTCRCNRAGLRATVVDVGCAVGASSFGSFLRRHTPVRGAGDNATRARRVE